MDPASRRRVRESTPRLAKPRRTLRESPSSPPRRKRKTGRSSSKQEEEEGQYWSLASPAILKEEKRATGLYYLLNWADIDPKTGQRYTASWENAENATEAAVKEWEQRKAEQTLERNASSIPDTQETQDTQNSEPIRTAKRKRGTPDRERTLQDGLESKKQRRTGASEKPRFQSASRESRERVIQDTYEDEQLSSDSGIGVDLCVEIGVPEGFDRNAYAPVADSSQSTEQWPTQSGRFPSQTTNPGQTKKKSFIWDEDVEDGEVLDSEEQLDSFSCRPSTTTTTQTSAPRLDRETVAVEPNSIGFQATQPSVVAQSSGSVSESLAEPQNFLAGSYRGIQAPSTPTQAESSIDDPHTIQQSYSTWKSSSKNESRSVQLPSRQVDDASQSLPSNDSLFISQDLHNQDFGNLTSSQRSEQFQTQILPSSSPIRESSLPSSSAQARQSIHSSQPPPRQSSRTHTDDDIDSESATLAHEPVPRRSLSATEAAVSSFEDTWHAAKIISSTPAVSQATASLPTSHEVDNRRSLLQAAEAVPEVTERASIQERRSHSRSAVNSQPRLSQEQLSQSKSSEEHPNQSSHLPSPPSEDALPSIEQAVDRSPAPARQDTPPSSSPISGSSPLKSASRASSLFSMDLDSNKPQSDYDAKEALKERMRLKLAERKEKTAADLAAREAAGLPPPPPKMYWGSTPPHNMVKWEYTFDPLPSDANEQEERIIEMATFIGDEFQVALPMVSYVRDMYNEELRQHKKLTALFVSDGMEAFDEAQVNEIDLMLDNLYGLCSHQDVYNDDFSTQQSESVTSSQQAAFAETCSTKCMFLSTMLNRLRSVDMNILILVRAGRMTEILEAILQSHELSYDVVGHQPRSQKYNDPLRITLHPPGSELLFTEIPNVIIAFDSTPTELNNFLGVRPEPKHRSPKLLPMISLLVVNSIEHLARCWDNDSDPTPKKISLVKSLRKMGDTLGQLKPEYEDPSAAAEMVARWLDKGAWDAPWPLPPMPDPDLMDSPPRSPPREGKEEANGDFAAQSHQGPGEDVLFTGTKRLLIHDDAMDVDSPKRQRLTPVPGQSAEDMDISRVNDTIAQQSSALPRSTAPASSSKTGTQGTQAHDISSLLKKIQDLEIRLSSKVASEDLVRRINDDLEKRCADYEVSIANIQPKYQEALNERGQFEHDMKLAITRENEVRRQLDAKNSQITKLKETNTAMTAELSATRQALATSAIPEVAEMAKMKEELTKAKADIERYEKRLASNQNDLDYMRINYQNSSSLAAESASELREVKASNAVLQAKADENRVRIHEIQRDENLATHLNTIKRLRAEKEELEKECDKRGEEIAALKASRRTTRGSMPGSPRMGGAMSPMRNIGRAFASGVAGGTRSRGNSPAPGEMGTFGGNLREDGPISSRGGGARWAGHLQ